MFKRKRILYGYFRNYEKRHSVRQYKEQPIEISKREIINACIEEVNKESGLSMQAFYDEPKCFDSFMAHYGKFVNVKNYIAIVGNKNDQEKAGYYGEKTMLKCQELGHADQDTEWFKTGMEAVSFAPTAMNQQKFLFELKDGKVIVKNLGGFYSKIDLGIVKYHFEAVTGHEVV